jgi:hypothetical protein
VTEIAMRKVLARDVPPLTQVLAAVDDASSQDLALVPGGKDVLVKTKVDRNMVQFRRLWVLAQKLSEACSFLHDKDEAMDFILIGCKHVRWVANPKTGLVFPVAKSISDLDGDRFARLYKRALYFICSEVVPGLDESALRAEIEQMVAPRIWEAA